MNLQKCNFHCCLAYMSHVHPTALPVIDVGRLTYSTRNFSHMFMLLTSLHRTKFVCLFVCLHIRIQGLFSCDLKLCFTKCSEQDKIEQNKTKQKNQRKTSEWLFPFVFNLCPFAEIRLLFWISK